MSGILGKVGAGVGAGLVVAGLEAYRDQMAQAREARLAQYQEGRDERLATQQTERDTRTFTQQDEILKKTQTHAAGESQKKIDADLKAAKIREDNDERRHTESMADRGATRGIMAKRLEIEEQESGIKRQLAEIELTKAQYVEKLRTEYPAADRERQVKIKEELRVLAGRDKGDSLVKVPKPDKYGVVTDYRLFDLDRMDYVDAVPPQREGADVKSTKQPTKPLDSFFIPSAQAKSGVIRRDP